MCYRFGWITRGRGKLWDVSLCCGPSPSVPVPRNTFRLLPSCRAGRTTAEDNLPTLKTKANTILPRVSPLPDAYHPSDPIGVLGPPPGQGGYYPQQPQQSYQGQPGYQQPYPGPGYAPQPPPQTVYVFVPARCQLTAV